MASIFSSYFIVEPSQHVSRMKNNEESRTDYDDHFMILAIYL